MKFFLVISTVPTLKAARKIAVELLKKKLAACIMISALSESHYVWKGKKETAREHMLLIKTQASRYRKLEAAIRQIHSYKNPEIIAVPIQKGSRDYLGWIRDSMC
ncbi:MAG: divalent-cation tolerance protein CutA [Candidatus Omnitrophica bacterium]|nr:divalent-cation tolerance protein CutA [Candidatus Omnitrophota bacterium]